MARQQKRLTNDQWETLQGLLLELQSGDRAVIDSHIKQYWLWKRKFSQRPNPTVTNKILNKLKGHLHQFLEDLGEADEDVTLALINPSLTSISPQGNDSPWVWQPTARRLPLDALDNMQEQIKRYIDWIEKAGNQLGTKKTGPDTGDVEWLVSALDGLIYIRSGKHITRSTKRGSILPFVKEVFKIADPGVGPGAIDGAIKSYIGKNRTKWASKSPVKTSR
ncbi:MAG: hypothetical protein JNM12_08680 [Alphaproteobacteria bacterium]|nr:hypothetical protein [Alphaproteobacteria bacterium]